MDDDIANDSGRGGDNAGNRLQLAQTGMDPTAERILISVGSIGGFILVCFVTWMVWRTMKKSKREGRAGGGGGGLSRRVTSKIPFFKRGGWRNLEDSTTSQSPPPSYREKTGSGRFTSGEGFYEPEKMQTQQPPQQPWPQNTPEPIILPGHGSVQSGIMYQPPPNSRDTYTAASRPHITLMTNIPAAYSHQPQGSFSSTNAAHFGAMMTPESAASPMHSGVSPASYYNQPLLTQQFTPYNPLYRQPSRTISEVSSLSSGFGDGDIIVTDPLITPPAPTAVPGPSPTNSPQQQQQQHQQQYTARFSWINGRHEPPMRQNSNASSNASSTGTGRRETVYTETSEDHPARFRSVTSWVDQQTGRIRRVQQRGVELGGVGGVGGAGGEVAAVKGGGDTRPTPTAVGVEIPGDPGIPGIHNPPREPSFGMMMDDEERPRRVEEVVGGGGGGGGGGIGLGAGVRMG
ncbi:hypothetical protein B0I37DRAFT_370001 [Chaetomium sp. MPI-CAGE-AT-0009]|nr:hypothetical protein B0I37DRAFT_370001 [Chaetomium sp. MPI-CAGE-AT-0009]